MRDGIIGAAKNQPISIIDKYSITKNVAIPLEKWKKTKREKPYKSCICRIRGDMRRGPCRMYHIPCMGVMSYHPLRIIYAYTFSVFIHQDSFFFSSLSLSCLLNINLWVVQKTPFLLYSLSFSLTMVVTSTNSLKLLTRLWRSTFCNYNSTHIQNFLLSIQHNTKTKYWNFGFGIIQLKHNLFKNIKRLIYSSFNTTL